MKQPPDSPETTRIQRVYRAYREEGVRRGRWSQANPGNCAIVQERARVLKQVMQEQGFFPLAERRILDIGCGSGRVLAGLMAWGAESRHLHGVDLLADRVEAAKAQFPTCDFRQANAEVLDFETASFDIVLLFAVFTSILDERMTRNVAAEVDRVLKPGGAVLWYDFRYNNPRNVHVRGVSKKKIACLFPGYQRHLRPVTLLPPLARRLGRLTSWLYPFLAMPPVLRTHYAGLLVKPQ
jgi:SAM-dependent methyltransferase